MQPIPPAQLLAALNWRYATKKMDPARAVPQEKVDRILEAVRLSASSSGLQPYEVIVVTNPELRARIGFALRTALAHGTRALNTYVDWPDPAAPETDVLQAINFADLCVLVSCDPAALGRDTALLADAGYDVFAVDLHGYGRSERTDAD